MVEYYNKMNYDFDFSIHVFTMKAKEAKFTSQSEVGGKMFSDEF